MNIVLLILTTICAAVLIKLSYWWIKRMAFIRKVEALPGPPAYPIVGSLLDVLSVPRNRYCEVLYKRIRKYAPIFRSWVGPMAEVNLTLPEHVEVILSSTLHIDKSFTYQSLEPWLGTGLLTSTGHKWQKHRKLITPTFHFNILESFLDIFIKQGNILKSKLQAKTGVQAFNIIPFITRCTLDVICETAMGTPVNAQEETGEEYVAAVHDMSELTVQRKIRPWLYPDIIFKHTKMGKRYYTCLNHLRGFTKKVIQERKQLRTNMKNAPYKEENIPGQKRRLFFLDLLLEASKDGEVLNDDEIEEEVSTFMFEGHDTTANSLAWTIFMLGAHPEVQDEVYKEQYEIFGDSDRNATMQDLQEMKYLERVIKETVRLYPAVPSISRRITRDVQIGNYNIPAGCAVNIHIYHLHRNPEQFPNPEEFNPDNFLPHNMLRRHSYAYIPFSAGPRNCIGQKFAMLELKMLISIMLRSFIIHSIEKKEDISLSAELILRPQNGVVVTLSPRSPTMNIH